MPTYTLGVLKGLVYDRVENNTQLYTSEEVTLVINEAIRITNLFSGFCQGSVQVPGFTVANQLLYNTPSPILFPTQVSFEGRVLGKIGLTRISEDIRNWATDTTSSYGPVARWVPIGINRFAIHPIDDIGGNDLLVTGVLEPIQLVNDGDVMQLDDEFVTLITEYGGHRLVLKEAGKIFADASVLIQTFWREMKRLKRWQGFKAPRYYVQVEQPK